MDTVKAVSYDVDLEQCAVNSVSSDLEKCNLLGGLWMPQKSPLKWWAWDLRGVLRVLNKNSAGVELPLWRLFCSFTRTDSGLDLAKEDKGPPHVVGGSSSPVKARAATWVPGDTLHRVLLCIGDVTVVVATVVAKSKGQCYLPREYRRKWTAHRMWGKRPWRDEVWRETKLAKMECSGSLAPRFVNNDSIMAEVINSTQHAHHEVLSWTWATFVIWVPPKKRGYCCCIMVFIWVSHERREWSMSTVTVAASARREYCYGFCISQERGCVVVGYARAAASARSQQMHPQFLRLLEPPSSLLAHALPTLGSGNSAHSQL